MSKYMKPQSMKVNIDPTTTTPNMVSIWSPGIDDISNMFSTAASLTPDEKNLKKYAPEIRKFPNID